jgi:hypothetical protein
LHHKMSKKIAQLTKVIYHLNTKNENHEGELDSLADQYESEIDMVCGAVGHGLLELAPSQATPPATNRRPRITSSMASIARRRCRY